jgi:hypothetical protein
MIKKKEETVPNKDDWGTVFKGELDDIIKQLENNPPAKDMVLLGIAERETLLAYYVNYTQFRNIHVYEVQNEKFVETVMYRLSEFTPDSDFKPTDAYQDLVLRDIVYPVLHGVPRLLHELTQELRAAQSVELGENEFTRVYILAYISAIKTAIRIVKNYDLGNNKQGE